MGSYITKPNPRLEEIREYLKEIHPGIPTITIEEGPQSHTTDKRIIQLMLHDNNVPYSIEYLATVFLHCYAFTQCTGCCHTPEWRQQYLFLINRAKELGIQLDQELIDSWC